MNIKIIALVSVVLMLFGAVYRILFMPFNGQPRNKKGATDERK